MNAIKMIGIALIVGGVLGLIYGGFSFTKETHEAKIGPIILSVADKETCERADLGRRGRHRAGRSAPGAGRQAELAAARGRPRSALDTGRQFHERMGHGSDAAGCSARQRRRLDAFRQAALTWFPRWPNNK